MFFLKIGLFFTLFWFNGCTKNLVAKNPCATPLTYQTNVLASGDDALKYASVYRAPIFVGKDNFTVSAIVDTVSADLLINENDYQYGIESVTGKANYVYQDGLDKGYAVNAKDQMDFACSSDIATKFSLTKETNSDSYLGLGFSDPKSRPHEKYSTPFVDQMVLENGYKNVFSLALCGPRSTSRLVLGGIDPDMVSFVGNFVPMLEKTAYTIPALSIRRSDNKKIVAEFALYDPNDKSGDRVIIDSSSPFLLLPTHMAQAVVNEVEKDLKELGLVNQLPEDFFRTERASSIKAARFASKAQINQLPSFEINIMGIDGKAKALEISPFHYLKEIDTKDPMFRIFAIRETSSDTIFGQPFLESQYTFFDRKNQLIGFGSIDIACAE